MGFGSPVTGVLARRGSGGRRREGLPLGWGRPRSTQPAFRLHLQGCERITFCCFRPRSRGSPRKPTQKVSAFLFSDKIGLFQDWRVQVPGF